MPRARTQTLSGRWLVLHAARLSGATGDRQIAVILEPAGPAEVAPLVLQAYGLTDREAQVAQLVLLGLRMTYPELTMGASVLSGFGARS
jgi:hypothetical protein